MLDLFSAACLSGRRCFRTVPESYLEGVQAREPEGLRSRSLVPGTANFSCRHTKESIVSSRGHGMRGYRGLGGVAGGALPSNQDRVKQAPEKRLALARISHHLTVEARHRPAITALRLLAVLNVLFKYASARRASRALY